VIPAARGPVSEFVTEHLRRDPHELPVPPDPVDDALDGEDAALALSLCYELHYGGLAGVSDGWEWSPTLLGLRARLEEDLLRRLVDEVGSPRPTSPAAARDGLLAIAHGDGPSLSAFIAEEGTVAHLREFAIHRSAYQLKEADPHTWTIPRVRGRAKAALVDIQVGEYGDGRPGEVHAELFATTMRALGLDDTPNAYRDLLPATTLATDILVSMLGLHRRWRGASVGHLAIFEMCSVVPMGRYAAAIRRLGFGDEAARFYDAHVEADERHQVVALDDMVAGLLEREPHLAGDVLFGARCVDLVERRFAGHLLTSWAEGRSSLRNPPVGSAGLRESATTPG